MEAYLEAMDPGVLMAAVYGFPEFKEKDKPVGDELNNSKWNAKARSILFRSISKVEFNSVRSAKDAHVIWTKLSEMNEGTRDECEERYKVILDKLNEFKMLPHENANQMYSCFNILVEELNDLNISPLKPIDVIRRILGILPKEKYANIVTIYHNKDLSTVSITQLLVHMLLSPSIAYSIFPKQSPPTLHPYYRVISRYKLQNSPMAVRKPSLNPNTCQKSPK